MIVSVSDENKGFHEVIFCVVNLVFSMFKKSIVIKSIVFIDFDTLVHQCQTKKKANKVLSLKFSDINKVPSRVTTMVFRAHPTKYLFYLI